MVNLTGKTIAQGALVLTITGGGVYYTTSDNMSPAGNGCIQYTLLDGTTKQLCGESASLVLDKAGKQQAAQAQKLQKVPTSTASIKKPTSQGSCQAKKALGLKLGPFCKIAIALDKRP